MFPELDGNLGFKSLVRYLLLLTMVFVFGAVYTMFDSPLDRGMSTSNLHFIQYPVVIPDDSLLILVSGVGNLIEIHAFIVHSFSLFFIFLFSYDRGPVG